MSAADTVAYRNPMTPGAPLIPRKAWIYPPFNRWTFQHVREMTPTAAIWRGRGPVWALPERLQSLEGLAFDLAGRRRTIRDFLDDSFTSGFLVLSRGAVVTELYMNGLEPHRPHLAMSVSKSIVATVCGILIHRGLVDPAALVTRYLPELEVTAYRDATVQQVLDMKSGVRFDESYGAPDSDIQKLDEVSGWIPPSRADGPQTVWQLVLTLTGQDRPHGQRFDYRSIETDVLGFVMERASGRTLADLIGSELWAPMGAEEDAYITVDQAGFALADGGVNATLRDLARFALLHLRDGEANGRQIVPSEWLKATRHAGQDGFEGEDRARMPRGSYRNQFWIEDGERGSTMCLGIHGQYIYLDPATDFAIVKLSEWPEAVSAERFAELLAATHAIRDFCARLPGIPR